MALSNLAVFSQQVYDSMTEILRQQLDLFNASSNGAFNLSSEPFQGDYSEKAFWKKLSGVVRRRNAYGSGTVSAINLEHLVDTMVKVAAGTPPINIPPSQMLWIQRSPEEMGDKIGTELAIETLADILNTSIAACYAALSNDVADIEYDGTAGKLAPRTLNNGSRKFGDRSSDITAWVMHSVPLHDYHDAGLANTERLFVYGTVNVIADFQGRPLIMTDSSSLIISGAPDEYITLGLVPGAVIADMQGDFQDNIETSNGNENILRTYQAEWSYGLGIKGYAWDKTNGGKSPTTGALTTATNWDRYATSHKDLAGVIVRTI